MSGGMMVAGNVKRDQDLCKFIWFQSYYAAVVISVHVFLGTKPTETLDQ